MNPTMNTARYHWHAQAYAGLAQDAAKAGSWARAALYADLAKQAWVQVEWE